MDAPLATKPTLAQVATGEAEVHVPIYEYRCHSCRRRSSHLVRSFAAAGAYQPECPHCHGRDLRRLISRISVIRSEGAGDSSDADLGDMPDLAGLDENDPRAMARMMRRMSEETGEGLGPELDQVVSRLEAGHSPEEIEKNMPNLAGPETGGLGSDEAGGTGADGLDSDVADDL